jgi:hypothetical protein
MIQGVPNKVFHEILSEVHIIANFVEGHFGFDHPEFGKMAGGVGVFGSKCRPKRVNLA